MGLLKNLILTNVKWLNVFLKALYCIFTPIVFRKYVIDDMKNVSMRVNCR